MTPIEQALLTAGEEALPAVARWLESLFGGDAAARIQAQLEAERAALIATGVAAVDAQADADFGK